MIEVHVILVLMIIGAIAAIEIEDMLSSVIAMGAVGIGLSLQFLLLRAPDLAITQLVVEILSLIILIKATVGAKMPEEQFKARIGYLIFALLFAAAFLFFSEQALRELPGFGSPLMKMGSEYLTEGLKKTGAANMVSAIILDFRGYDTLGEATVLFTSVIGVLAVLRIMRKRA
jgi:multisubunit Na+/H+ antiporter MnhB subunit